MHSHHDKLHSSVLARHAYKAMAASDRVRRLKFRDLHGSQSRALSQLQAPILRIALVSLTVSTLITLPINRSGALRVCLSKTPACVSEVNALQQVQTVRASQMARLVVPSPQRGLGEAVAAAVGCESSVCIRHSAQHAQQR